MTVSVYHNAACIKLAIMHHAYNNIRIAIDHHNTINLLVGKLRIKLAAMQIISLGGLLSLLLGATVIGIYMYMYI